MTDDTETNEDTQSEDSIITLNNPVDVFDEPSNEESDDSSESEETTEEGEKGEETDESDDETSDETEDTSESPSDKDTSDTEKALKAELARTRQRARDAEEKLKGLNTEQDKVPDPVEDPEGYQKWIMDKANQERMNDKLNMSRDIMLDSKEDYEEMEKIFMELVGNRNEDDEFVITDPTLHQKFLNAPNPARFAYNHAKEHLETKNLKSDKEALEKQVKELEAELEKVKSGKKSATEVPDVTTAAASGKNKAATPAKESADPEEVFEDLAY